MSKLLPDFESSLNGQLNHYFYFEGLAPTGEGAGGDLTKPDSFLYKKINSIWGSIDNFFD